MSEPSSASSKRETLKSTSLLGGGSAINMLIKMVRTKVLAVLLGPTGIALEAIYGSVLQIVGTVFDLGLGSAGTRQVAASVASGDSRRVSTTVYTLRRVCLLVGVMSAVTIFLAREWISVAAFGDTTHAPQIAWLSIIPIVGSVGAGWGALLTGMRRIADMVRMGIIGSVLATAVSIAIVFIWGQAGITAFMITNTLITVLVTWFFVRRIKIEPVRVKVAEVLAEARDLISLGVAFMSTTLLATGATFLVRAIITREHGLEGAGQFQAATSLSMVYIGFVVGALVLDFYPRLTGLASDDVAANRLVNEQSDVTITLALPGLLATVALAPWVLHVFYADSFRAAADILVWQVLGMLVRLMAWPLGFVLMAKALKKAFVLTDVAAWVFYVVLAWACMKTFGLAGAGIAFLVMYVLYVAMMRIVIGRLTGFRWDREYVLYASAGLAAAALAAWARLAWPEPWATLLPCLLAAIAGLHSLRKLALIIGLDKLEQLLQKVRMAWVLRMFPRLLK